MLENLKSAAKGGPLLKAFVERQMKRHPELEQELKTFGDRHGVDTSKAGWLDVLLQLLGPLLLQLIQSLIKKDADTEPGPTTPAHEPAFEPAETVEE